eukprot:121815-Pelagomonas_calceolata.AAC.2
MNGRLQLFTRRRVWSHSLRSRTPWHHCAHNPRQSSKLISFRKKASEQEHTCTSETQAARRALESWLWLVASGLRVKYWVGPGTNCTVRLCAAECVPMLLTFLVCRGSL